ncbi:MAG: hypothetical protein Q4D98_03445 [Planctomycetia bacterium]|nr:hypothetical protein [Planctomycetia bacterium]
MRTIQERITELESQKTELEAALLKPSTSAFGISRTYNHTAMESRLAAINEELSVLYSRLDGTDGTFEGIRLF